VSAIYDGVYRTTSSSTNFEGIAVIFVVAIFKIALLLADFIFTSIRVHQNTITPGKMFLLLPLGNRKN
jgi:hypothetical protein